MLELAPLTLTGRHGALVPLATEHAVALGEASAEGELFKLWFTNVPSPAEMKEEIEWRLAEQDAGVMLPFTILDAEGVPVGMTTFCHIDVETPRVEIGYTWYGKRVQRTPLNTECKRLLLGQALDNWGCLAVEFRVAHLNHRSQRAVERLGAKLDGVIRSHRYYKNGTIRDTHVYSITAGDWPAVKTHLDALLTG